MKVNLRTGLLSAVSGACALVVAMGLGRFAYTALLPGMMIDYGFDKNIAGMMASWNYAGYLLGVLSMRNVMPGRLRYILLSLALWLSIATTAGMGLTYHIVFLHALRFIAGMASGACFVLCSAIVLDTLNALNRPSLAGILYSGVGLGISLSAIASSVFEGLWGAGVVWILLALVCLPLVLLAQVGLHPRANYVVAKKYSNSVVKNNNNAEYFILLFAYFLEGFGYIIGVTFLVALIKVNANSQDIAGLVWGLTGCAAAVSAPFWRYAAKHSGYKSMLILAFILQGIGVLLPVVFKNTATFFLGGLLLGGTFMGITVLALQYGVGLSHMSSAHTISIMTALYGVGQILGPLVVGLNIGDNGFSFAFILSAITLFFAALIMFFGNMILKYVNRINAIGGSDAIR